MSTFRIQVCSDVDYDKLIVEVYVDEKFVALVNQERDDGVLEVVFPGPDQNEPAVTRHVALPTLLEALEEAKKELAR